MASVRTGEALVYGEPSSVTAVTPNSGSAIDLEWKDGSQAVFSELRADGAFVDDGFADDHNLTVGSPISITTPAGKQLDLTVRGIFDPPAGGSPFGNVTFSSDTFDAELRPAAEPLLVRRDRRRRHGREHAVARERARRLPQRQGADARGVQGQPGQLPQQHPQHPLRAARAVRRRQPLRHRQHARPDRVRAHARARACCGRLA